MKIILTSSGLIYDDVIEKVKYKILKPFCNLKMLVIPTARKGVIYLGASAGTHIATQNIKHVLNFDDNYSGVKKFKGLGLFNGIIICHYNESRKNIFENLEKKKEYTVYSLTDKEIIYFDVYNVYKI